MSKHPSRFLYMNANTPPTRHASLEELTRRGARLRTAIKQERDLARVVDRFFDAFSNEHQLYETSVRSEEPRLHAVLESVRGRFPGEVFETHVFFSEALGLHHGSLCSARRLGCVFQFAGEDQGVIALSPLFPGTNSDLFRYTLVLAAAAPTRTVSCRGGSA
jgi:hypothetical protein